MSAESIIEMIEEKFGGRAYITLTVVDWSRLRAEIVRLRGEVAFAASVIGKYAVESAIRDEGLDTHAPAEAKGDWQYESMRFLAYKLRQMSAISFDADTCSDAASWLEKLSSHTPQPAGGEAVAPLGYVRRDAIRKLREDDEVTGVMVHIEAPTDSVPVYTHPPAAQVQQEAAWDAITGMEVSVDVDALFNTDGRRLFGTVTGWQHHDGGAILLVQDPTPNWDAAHPSACELGAVRDWQSVDTAPKDGTWILLRGHNAAGQPMIPAVAAFRPAGATHVGWVDSGSFRVMDSMADEWMPLTAALQHRGDSRGGEG